MQITRRTLLDGEVLRINHVCARPPMQTATLDCQSTNLLVLPLTGLFAKHDGRPAR
jgi:hypothetical protein